QPRSLERFDEAGTQPYRNDIPDPRFAQGVAVERNMSDFDVAHSLDAPIGAKVFLGLLRGAKAVVVDVTRTYSRAQRYGPCPAVLVRIRPCIGMRFGGRVGIGH